jgi:selenide,water dikinase
MLAQVLRPIQGLYRAMDYPNLLVGLEGPDDAAVWQMNDKTPW